MSSYIQQQQQQQQQQQHQNEQVVDGSDTPSAFPLKNIDADVKFRAAKTSSSDKANKINIDTSKFILATHRRIASVENSRKRRNFEEQVSNLLTPSNRNNRNCYIDPLPRFSGSAASTLASPSSSTNDPLSTTTTDKLQTVNRNDDQNTTNSGASQKGDQKSKGERQPASKRRLVSIENATGADQNINPSPSATAGTTTTTTTTATTNTNTSSSGSQQSSLMPPPSSDSSALTTTGDDVQPPLPSPSASPTQSQDEDEIMTQSETNSNSNMNSAIARSSKNGSYMKIPTTEEGVVSAVENLMEFLTQKQKDALTWKLLTQTDRSKLSILSNIMHKSLKRDLISTLPTEISYKILRYLDSKSLIHAEQVCKNWFRIVNRSGDLWKILIKEEKYITNEEELEQELQRKDELLNEWTKKDSNLPVADERMKDDYYKYIYKKRHIIHQRWMDPQFQPKRITVKVHGSAVITCLQFDDDKIITGADDNYISIYDTKTGRLRNLLEGHTGGVWALKYYKNTLVSGATDRTVRVWNIKKAKCTHVFRGHTSTVRCLDILTPEIVGYSSTGAPIVFPEEPLLITGSRDNTIHVWKLPLASEDDSDIGEPFDSVDSNNPYFVRALRGHIGSVRCISGRGNIVVSGSYDMTVRVWDLATGRCTAVLRSHTDKVYSTVLDMENKRCISGSMDSTVKIWDLRDGHCINTLVGHSSLVGLLELSDTALVSAAADATLRIWDPITGEPRHQLKGHTGAITCFQHDDKKVVSGSEKMLKLWDINTGKFVRQLLPEVTGSTWQVKFDYRRCISAVQNRHDGTRPDETLMEILDFGEPYYSSDETMHDLVDEFEDTSMDQDINTTNSNNTNTEPTSRQTGDDLILVELADTIYGAAQRY